MKNFMIILTGLLVSTITHAGKCQVEVTYHHQTGFTDKESYMLETKSKQDCESRKKLYEVNTAPKKLKSKEVKIKWLG